MTASGFLLFDKPAGKTSFAALSGFRRAFPGARIGHTGTLDSFATGLLIVVVGTYSRLASWFVGLDKVYEAEIRFGIGTDTLDPCGGITDRGPVPTREALEAVLPKFRGEIKQIPPDYSALHVAGKRASDLARKGDPLHLPPRPVKIMSLSVDAFDEGKASMRIHCSSGTYVRSLARDIAAACGTYAHVSALRRVSVGPFSVRDAISQPEDAAESPLRLLDPETAAQIGMRVGVVPEDQAAAFSNGAPFALPAVRFSDSQGSPAAKEADMAVFSPKGALLGVLEHRSGGLGYKHVMPKGEGDR